MNISDDDRFPSAESAKAGIDALIDRANRLSASSSAIAMQTNLLCQHMATILEAIERSGKALPKELSAPATAVEVLLTSKEFEAMESLVRSMQNRNQHSTKAECMQKIFMAGVGEIFRAGDGND